ncbi:D-malate degradation protein R [Legionella massiliensis]|uniref:D-malate degradation protein R n=1 Tax=Legionella massiliensis TaxID=1034943 RepID=A0A078L0Y1_9GAMM|nr:LysR family transcriptional regulator [Legionella massiliensis]CDZ77694.1 D-malate degradation protein R [Legionella massiliensis]CEE13432.1 HTH-type transcriptional regulator DmlR [Legionella massiliensis]
MYNQRQISCFLKVAELANFSLAANSLHLTPTAVSKQIKNLEEAIGEQLFLRTTRNVQLTEFGQLFYERCKLIDEQITAVNQFIESNREQPQGELKVLVSTITSKDWVLKHLHDFVAAYPGLQLELIFSEQDDELARSDIDIMVGFPVIPPATEALKYRRMFAMNNILCASKSFVLRYGKPKTAEELPNFKIISHSLRKPAHFISLADGSRLHCARPILYMNSFDALNQACLAGIGMFLTGDSLVKSWLESGELLQLLPQYTFRHHEIYMFYRAYDYELPKIRAFLDFFNERLA